MSKNKIPHLHMCFPNRDSGDVSEREDSRPVEAACDGDFKKPPEKQDVMVSSSDRKVENRVDSALWAVIQQVYTAYCSYVMAS